MNNFGREEFEAFAYLDYDNRVASWNIARGLFSTSDNVNVAYKNSLLSIMTVGLLTNSSLDRFKSELVIELIRAKKFPNCVSRLKGIFVFDEIESISRFWECNNWGGHFSDKYLSDVGVATNRSTRVDSNWIAYIVDKNGRLNENCEELIENYWQGKVFPGKKPIWERIIEGHITVWSANIRQEACKNILSIDPEANNLLTYSSLCANIGSMDGQVYPIFQDKGEYLVIEYIMLARNLDNNEFLDLILELGSMKPSINIELPTFTTNEVRTPNFSGFSHKLKKSDYINFLQEFFVSNWSV